VVVADVPAGVTVVGIPAKVVMPRAQSREFRAYGTPTGEIPDPVARAIDGLLDQVSRLQARIDQLETQAAAGNGVDDLPAPPQAEASSRPSRPQNG
jgi:serine O-acetyltransferase